LFLVGYNENARHREFIEDCGIGAFHRIIEGTYEIPVRIPDM
jgi:hypothetical protein